MQSPRHLGAPWPSLRNLLFALPLATFTVACGVEELEADAPRAEAPVVADEAIGQAEQQVSIYGPYTWRTNQPEYISTSLGASSNRTCFLTALGGNLQSTPNDLGWGMAGVLLSGSEWRVFVNQTLNTALSTTVQCVNAVANRTSEVAWYTGEAAKLLGAVTADRRCFLTSIVGAGGFDSTAEYVRVWNDGLNWYLGGDLVGDGGAKALCVDIPEDHGAWQWSTGANTKTVNLAYNPDGIGCFLHGLGGNFNQNSYSDGVSVDYNAGTRTWEMNLSAYKRGWASCVK
ncbi:hypothetical protein [Myxococcus landrumensis]|uniref:hypothetical protein n=1 Tax=Myxococcus landrumensis TaxID=2813577 RepID=UPI001F50D4B3|nr:hypothetical protein [Myxococcus landrumus]